MSNLAKIASEMSALGGFFEKDLPEIASQMPFQLIPDEPVTAQTTIEVAGFALPKMYGITQGEALIMGEVWERSSDDMSVATLKMALATVLLMFRYDRSWNLNKSFNLTSQALDAIFDYYNNERTEWKQPEAVEETETESTAPVAKKKRVNSGSKTSSESSKPSQPIAAISQKTLAVTA